NRIETHDEVNATAPGHQPSYRGIMQKLVHAIARGKRIQPLPTCCVCCGGHDCLEQIYCLSVRWVLDVEFYLQRTPPLTRHSCGLGVLRPRAQTLASPSCCTA